MNYFIIICRYPCMSPKAEYNEEKVYSGTVACARFLFNDRNIVTVGGTDAALMLWELVEEQQKAPVYFPAPPVVNQDNEESDYDSDIDTPFEVLQIRYG